MIREMVAVSSLIVCFTSLGAPSLSAQGLLATLASPNPCSKYAYSISGGADIDGDGVDDLVVGDPWCSVRIISGKDGSEIVKLATLDTTTIFGAKVAIIGDTNGDGSIEIGVGAPEDHGQAVYGPGRVYAIAVPSGAVLHSWTDTNYWFGRALASAGDFDGDGSADLIVGSLNSTGIDSLWVYSGSNWNALLTVPSGSPFTATLGIGKYVAYVGDLDGNGTDEIAASGETGFSIRGSKTFDQSDNGYAARVVCGGADFTGDGVPDLAIGHVTPSFGGGVDIWSGADFTPFGGYAVPTSVAPKFGGTIAIPGDLTGDGRADLVVGSGDPSSSAPFLPTLGDAGKVWVLSFATPGFPTATTLSGSQGFGGVVAGIGDVNGNGSPEFAVREGGTVRVYTGACGSIASYFDGVAPCYGFGGIEPKLAGHGCATPGGIVYFDITQAPGKSLALFLFGTQQSLVPMGFGCALKVAPLIPALLGPLPLLPIGASGPGVGFLTIAGKLPMPLPPATITMQVFIADASGAAGFAATNALEMQIE